MKHFFCALLGVSLLSLIAGCGNNNPFKTAEKAADAGNWKMAMASAEQAVKNHPQDVKGLLLLAVAADKCNQREIALNAALRAVKINEKDFAAQYTLGRLCVAGETERVEGLKHLIAAHELNPNAVEPLILICNTMQKMNHQQTASFLLKLQNFEGYNANADLCNNLAIAYMKKGQTAGAKFIFMKAYNLDPNNPDILLNMARFFETTKWWRLSGNYYRFFLQKAANRPEYRDEVSAVQQRLNRK